MLAAWVENHDKGMGPMLNGVWLNLQAAVEKLLNA
jgi:hypothetical protein